MHANAHKCLSRHCVQMLRTPAAPAAVLEAAFSQEACTCHEAGVCLGYACVHEAANLSWYKLTDSNFIQIKLAEYTRLMDRKSVFWTTGEQTSSSN